MIKKKILIATGGTGGHIIPAYSLANHFTKNNFIVNLTSDKRGLKYLDYCKNLKVIKISSSPLVKKNIFKFFISISIIFFSIIKSLLILITDRPTIIFGMGGYSSFPICIAAAILRIKFIIYENNLYIGKANKYLLPFTEKIFVAYKELEGIPEKYNKKVLEVGNILRDEIINSKNNEEKFTKFDTLKILVLGGSQAAKVFADDLPSIFKKLNDTGLKVTVYQQCLESQINQLSNFYKNTEINYKTFNFTDKIIDYYLRANLVITRSGASVLGELINVKIPFITIPLPSSADNHQYKNAEFYEKKGYGYLLEEKDIKNKMYDLINSLIKNKSRIENIFSNQRQYSDKNIFQDLNIQVDKILNEKN